MADHTDTPRHEDALDRAIRHAEPIGSAEIASPAVRSALAALATEVARLPELSSLGRKAPSRHKRWFADERAPARRGGPRRLAGLIAATLFLVGSVSAVGAVAGVGLWSGWFDSPSSSESVAGEQYVNVASPQFAAEFDRATRDYPLPVGATYARLKSNVIATGGLKQLSGMRGQMALYGTCPWIASWLRADASGETRQRTIATTALTRIAQSRDLEAIDGGGIVAGAIGRAKAAAAGDGSPLAEYQAAVCGGR